MILLVIINLVHSELCAFFINFLQTGQKQGQNAMVKDFYSLSVCVCVCVCVCVPSHVQLFVTPWTVARQTPLSVNFPQGYWSGLPFPPPGNLPDPGIEPWSPALQADS